MRKLYFTLLACLFLLAGVCSSGQAATTFNNLVVFGDSLSDTGNISRRSDGDIWVETLSESLEAALYNYAYAGATTGYDNPAAGLDYTGLLWQVDETANLYYTPSLITGTSLVALWAGANDFLQGRGYQAAVDNIETALESLYDDGFRYFMVPNLPDIGATPLFRSYGSSVYEAATFWSDAFNTALAVMLADFVADEGNDGVVLYSLDIYTAFSSYMVDSEEWAELFWTDFFHPSSTGHALIASIAGSAVPVPHTAFLLVTGLLGLTLAGRKWRNRIQG